MQSSLAVQLEKIAAKSTNTLNVRKLKDIHATSLLFPPSVAATQDLDTVYAIALEGFHELCRLDKGFTPFERGLFSESSKNVDRFLQTKDETKALDASITAFLQLVSGRLLLKPALKAVEWLVRRFRVQDQNTTALILTFLPYHEHKKLFPSLLSIIAPKDLSRELVFLRPYLKSATPVPRHVIIHTLSHRRDFFELLTSHVIFCVRARRTSHTLLSFFAAVFTEAVSLLCDGARTPSNKGTTEEDVLQRTLPVLEEAYRAKKEPEFQIGAYMATTVLVAKIPMSDQVYTALMSGIAESWSVGGLAPALSCIALIAQTRTGPGSQQLPDKLADALIKIDDLERRLVGMGEKYRVDKLTVGLCRYILAELGQRFGKKDLSVVIKLLEDLRMSPTSRKAILARLVMTAQKLQGFADPGEEEAARDLLATSFLRWAEKNGKKLGKVLQEVLEEKDVDVEMLELALRTVLRPAQIEAVPQDASGGGAVAVLPPKEVPSFESILRNLPTSTDEVSFLKTGKSGLLIQLQKAFLLATVSTKDMRRFREIELFTGKPASSAFELSFYARMWCSNSVPILGRATALKQATHVVKKHAGEKIDYQALLVLTLIALADPAERVRSAAAKLVSSIQAVYNEIEASSKSQGKKRKLNASSYWAIDSIYGTGTETQEIKWLETTEAKKLVDIVLAPYLQECIMDAGYVTNIIKIGLSSNPKADVADAEKTESKRLHSSTKTGVLTSLASHTIHAPLLVLKLRLLSLLNHIVKAPASKTKLLLPLLQAWIAEDRNVHVSKCSEEHIDIESLQEHIVGIVGDGEKLEGLQPLLDIITKNIGGESLVSAAASRITTIWPTLKPEIQVSIAEPLLETALKEGGSAEPGRSEAMGTLRAVSVPTETFLRFLDKAHDQVKSFLSEMTGAAKRRRTSVAASDAAEKEKGSLLAMKRTTAIVELLETQGARNHTPVLQKLFSMLGEVDNAEFAGITYLQNVLIGCTRDIVDTYKTSNKNLQSEHTIRADVLVNCIRSSTSPQVQNSALLLLASLADVAPDTVKHSVMPIFTFMGASTLRQDDEYSAHVIEQTIRRVIPPLIKSFQEQEKGVLLGVADLVNTFVSSYRYVPTHRRLHLFASLAETMGADDFLFALIAKLAVRHNVSGQDGNVAEFAAQLAGGFSAQTQIHSVLKYLEAITDVLEPKANSVVKHLFDGEDEIKSVPATEVARRLLDVLQTVLYNERLKSKVARTLVEGDEQQTTQLRGLFTQTLASILSLGEKYTKNEQIRGGITPALEHLLELLSTSEFVIVVESLINHPETQFRRSALATFKLRIESERRADATSRISVLSLAPKIAGILSDATAEIDLKSDALGSLNAVITRFGKQKPERIAELSEAIVGPGALRSTDNGLQVFALVCLASMTRVLGGRIVPVLPKTIPFALDLFGTSVEDENELLHNAVLVYFDELCKVVPSFMHSYLSKMLPLVAASAETAEFDDSDAAVVRTEFLDTVADKLDTKVVVVALTNCWKSAVEAGPDAVAEQLETLQKVIARASKSTVQKLHQHLLNYFLLALDVRNAPDFADEDEVEELVIKTLVGMVFKLNDSIFKPMFLRIVEWALAEEVVEDEHKLRRMCLLWDLLGKLTQDLKSLVTDYYSYILDPAVSQLSATFPADAALPLRAGVSLLGTLKQGFATDERDFWQSPTHHSGISSALLSQLAHAPELTPALVILHVVPCIVELAAAASSDEHFKNINTALCRAMRNDASAVRLVAVRALRELYTRLGEEWLGLLAETVPFIAEILEDDDEEVEREARRLVVAIEKFQGEGELQAMLT